MLGQGYDCKGGYRSSNGSNDKYPVYSPAVPFYGTPSRPPAYHDGLGHNGIKVQGLLRKAGVMQRIRTHWEV